MLQIIWPYILVSLIGTIANILKELARLENLSEEFKFSTWLGKNRFKTIYGFIVAILTIVILYQANELTWSSAIMAGYMGDSLLKTKIARKKQPN